MIEAINCRVGRAFPVAVECSGYDQKRCGDMMAESFVDKCGKCGKIL